MLWLLAPVPVLASTFRRPRRWVAILAALIASVTMIGVAVGISDELRWQRHAREAFAAFTHRSPPGD